MKVADDGAITYSEINGNSDKVMDFSTVGYHMGNKSLPNVPPAVYVEARENGAYNDDDTARLQAVRTQPPPFEPSTKPTNPPTHQPTDPRPTDPCASQAIDTVSSMSLDSDGIRGSVRLGAGGMTNNGIGLVELGLGQDQELFEIIELPVRDSDDLGDGGDDGGGDGDAHGGVCAGDYYLYFF